MSAELYDLLSELGIPTLKSYRPGHSEKLVCPRCGGGKTRDHCLSVTVADDGMSAMYQCHRGNCDGFRGKVFVRDDRHDYKPKPKPRPRPFSDDPPHRPDWMWKFFGGRHIGARTVEHFGIYATKHPNLGDAIVFPYKWEGRLINRKYRGYPKKDFRNDAGTQPTLFNVDSIVPGQPLYWNEGEMCVLTMHEVGYTSVVSLRDGAPQQVGQGDRRFEALKTHADLLSQVSEHILCPDADAPGEAWLEELTRRLDRHKCKVVRWPKGRKDANDTLCQAGDDPDMTIQAAVERAERLPLEGIRDITPEVIESVWARERPGVMTLGVSAIDAKLRFPTEGKLIVVTGVPSHGKSTFMRFVALRTIQRFGRKWLAFVQEDDFDDYIIECTKIFAEKSYHDITEEDRRNVGLSLSNGGMRILEFDGEANPPTMDAIFKRAQMSILQDGTTDLMIDPFNEVEDAFEHGTMTQTQHIGRTLQRAKAFAKRNACNVWIIAHPRVPGNGDRGPPDLYSISGSANWANKPDLGFTVYRNKDDGVEIHIGKSRTMRWGSAKTKIDAWFNISTSTYHEPMPKDPPDKPPPTMSPFNGEDDYRPYWQND